jgi:hypothetical protein
MIEEGAVTGLSGGDAAAGVAGDPAEQRQDATEDSDDDETGDEFAAQIGRHAQPDQQAAGECRRQHGKPGPLPGKGRLKPGVEIDVGQCGRTTKFHPRLRGNI